MLTRRVFNFPGVGSMNPLVEMERMRRQMDALSGLFRGPGRWREASAGVFPLINLTEDKDNYLVRAELPGVKTEDVDIQIVEKSMTISGERKILSEGENVKYHRRERDAGKFSRVIGLPGEIDSTRVDAKLVNGLLTVVVPKAEAAKPRKITIH